MPVMKVWDAESSTWKMVGVNEADKQDTLVSGENIKTINSESILGEGNLVIESGGFEQTFLLMGA